MYHGFNVQQLSILPREWTICLYSAYFRKVEVGYSVWLQTGRQGFDPRQRRKDFPLACVQTSSGAHPASYPMCTGGPFPGGKARLGRDADHSPPFSAEVKNEWELYFSPPWRLHGVAGKFSFLYFYFLEEHCPIYFVMYTCCFFFEVGTQYSIIIFMNIVLQRVIVRIIKWNSSINTASSIQPPSPI
jgi:hypothetical protein